MGRFCLESTFSRDGLGFLPALETGAMGKKTPIEPLNVTCARFGVLKLFLIEIR